TPPAKRAKAGKVEKKRTLKRSQQLVDEFVDEGIPLTEPGFGDLEVEPGFGDLEVDTVHIGVLSHLWCSEKLILESISHFQRRTSAPTEPSSHDKSSSLYVELGLTESDTESDKEVPPVVKSGAPDEGQAGPNPGNDTVSQTLSTPGVHAGPNLEHTDAEATDATIDDPVILEEPSSSTGMLSSLQHLAKDFSFGDQFFNDKPSEANNKKATSDTKAESMVSVTIHQDTSVIPPMTSPVIDLALEERLDKHGSRLYRLENQDIPNQVSKVMDEIVTDAIDWAMQAPLRERFRDLPEADMKEILHNGMWKSKSYQTHEDHIMLYEALEKSMAQDNRD
ncbi:hypothetical protein Tco_1488788, partial [Tanacetum coccineum]